MGKQTINYGITPGDKTGESIYESFKKSKENFDELYSATAERLQVSDIYDDFIVTGLATSVPANSLNGTLSVGVTYVDGVRTERVATSLFTYAVSSDTYVDMDSAGVVYRSQVANGAAAPVLTAGRIRIEKVITDGTKITAVESIAPRVAKAVPMRINDITGQLERWDAAAGAYVAVGATSLLSVTTIRFASNTAGLATSSDLAFDTVLRDDLGLATGMTAGRIRIPSNCTQFRISYSVGAVPVAGGSYRRLQVGIYTANDALGGIATVNSLITLGIRSSVREVPSAGMITAAQQNDLALSTHLIDCSTLPTPLSTNAAYADNQYVKLTLTHDIGSALQVIGSGSSFTLECYTPA